MDRRRISLVAGKEIPVFKIKTDRFTLGLRHAGIGQDDAWLGKNRLERGSLRKPVLLDRGKGSHQHAPAVFSKIGRRHQAADIHARNPHQGLNCAAGDTAWETVYNGGSRHLGNDINPSRKGVNNQGFVVECSRRIAKAYRLRSLRHQPLPEISGRQVGLGQTPDHQLGPVECVIACIGDEEIVTFRIRPRAGGDILEVDI